jgi:hypothetical protein
MSQWHGGKGSGRRKQTDDKSYSENYDRIFGKKKKPEPNDKKKVKE